MKGKKTVIGVNHQAKELFEVTLQAKISAFNDLFSYCQQFVSITDIKAFSEAPKSQFLDLFIDQYSAQFPNIVSVNKQLELCEIEFHKIEALESNFLGINLPAFDVETLTAPHPDFNIYCADSEAEKRYHQTIKIVDILNDFRSENTCYPANLISGLNGSISFDFGQNKFVLNINFINSIPQRNY